MARLISLLALAFVCCKTEVKTSDAQAVEGRIRQYYIDFSNRDWEKFRSHFWQNATITTAWQQPGDSLVSVDVTTVEDFILEAPAGPGSQPIFEEWMINSEIKTRGNLAEVWVDYGAKFGTKDNLAEWTGKDLFTLLRHDGEWKIVSIVFESDK